MQEVGTRQPKAVPDMLSEVEVSTENSKRVKTEGSGDLLCQTLRTDQSRSGQKTWQQPWQSTGTPQPQRAVSIEWPLLGLDTELIGIEERILRQKIGDLVKDCSFKRHKREGRLICSSPQQKVDR